MYAIMLSSLMIGEPGTGETSLVSLAWSKLNDTSSIAYVDVPTGTERHAQMVQGMRNLEGPGICRGSTH